MKTLFFLLAAFFLASCAKKYENDAEMKVELMMMPAPSQNELADEFINTDKNPTTRKLIKDGFVEFETSDLEKTKNQIAASVSANKGYISSDKQNKAGDKISYTIIVRIPTDKFDSFLKSATQDVLYFENKQINVKDVTAEYLDNETRLKTKKEIELRYRQLLIKASSVNDVLNIEKELGTIRTEIEAAEGQLKYLSDQIQYSTLRINFYKITSTPSLFSDQIKLSLAKGWENLLGSLLMVMDVWPFVLFGVGLWFVFWKVRRPKMSNHSA